MPRNASIGRSGARIYEWTPADGSEPTSVLSVTSIRRLCGLPPNLVEWGLKNVVNLAMGVRQQVRIGPRGGVSKAYVQDGPAPGEFVKKMIAADGAEIELARIRKWLRDAADEPRDVAAVRGSVVHKLIEINLPLQKATEKRIIEAFEAQWADERGKTKRAITTEDYHFVLNCLRNYWYMRATKPYVILAAEPQLFNLTAGFAGSADVLIWLLPDGSTIDDIVTWQAAADNGAVTLDAVQRFGGELMLGDYKTSEDIHTDNVVQETAYLSAEFIGRDGQIDERLTALLRATHRLVVIHIRPNAVGLYYADYRADVLRAFLGSVAFARFLAAHETPADLFTETWTGSAPEIEEDVA